METLLENIAVSNRVASSHPSNQVNLYHLAIWGHYNYMGSPCPPVQTVPRMASLQKGLSVPLRRHFQNPASGSANEV